MWELLDYRALFLASGIVSGVLLALLALRTWNPFPGFSKMVVGLEVLAAAIVIGGFRGYAPDALFSVQVAALVGFALIDRGIRMLCETPQRGRWPYVYVLGAVLVLSYLYFTSNLRTRIVFTSLFLMAIFIDAALPLLRTPPEGLRFGSRFTATVFMLWCLAGCIRIVAVGLSHSESSSYFESSAPNTVFFLLVLFLLAALAFAFIALTHERVVKDLETAHAKTLSSETRFRVLTENIPQLVWIADADGHALYFSRRWYEYTGQSEGEALGLGWQNALHSEDRSRVAKKWAQALLEKHEFDLEYRLRRVDGAYRWFIARGQPIRDESGTIIRWVGTCTDIAGRRESEEQQRLLNERFLLALEASNSGTWEWDIKRNINRWGPMTESLHGFGHGTFPGTHEAWLERVLPEDAAQAEAAITEALKTGSLNTQWRIRRKNDGRVRWMLSRARVHFDQQGEPESMIGINVDITDRKRDEERLRLSEQRYRSLVRASSQLVWTCDADGHLRHELEDWQHFTGQTAEELRCLGWSSAIHPEDRDETVRAWQCAVEAKSIYTVEHRLRRHDGTYRHMQVRAVPVLDGTGQVTEWVGMHTDVTERKLAEERLRRTEKLDLAGRLALSVSHEVNNPLAAVTNIIYLVARDSNLSASTRELMRVAERELARASQVVTQTLRFAKSSSTLGNSDMQETVEAAIAIFQSRFKTSDIAVERDYRTNKTVYGYPDELQHVVANLVSNAFDAMRSGGRLKVRVREATAWNGAPVHGLRLSIGDTGTGIPRALTEKIFEPFVSTKEFTGTGLGLWVSSEIVHRHKGQIAFRTSTDPRRHGTVFSMFLPFQTPANDEPAGSLAPERTGAADSERAA